MLNYITFLYGEQRMAGRKSGSLQFFDASTLEEIFKIVVGGFPIGLLIDPSGQKAYVALSSDSKVLEIDLQNFKITGEIQTGHEPDGMGYSDLN